MTSSIDMINRFNQHNYSMRFRREDPHEEHNQKLKQEQVQPDTVDNAEDRSALIGIFCIFLTITLCILALHFVVKYCKD